MINKYIPRWFEIKLKFLLNKLNCVHISRNFLSTVTVYWEDGYEAFSYFSSALSPIDLTSNRKGGEGLHLGTQKYQYVNTQN